MLFVSRHFSHLFKTKKVRNSCRVPTHFNFKTWSCTILKLWFYIFVIRTDVLLCNVVFVCYSYRSWKWSGGNNYRYEWQWRWGDPFRIIKKRSASCTQISHVCDSSTINDYFVQKVEVFAPVITPNCFQVFRDILVRIRMLSFVPLTNGSESVPKSSVTLGCKKKNFLHIFKCFNQWNLKALKLEKYVC